MPTFEFCIETQSHYEAEQSAPDEGRFRFAYKITIRNTGTIAAQLIARHWLITDANGMQQEVHGLGVVGRQPLIAPNESFSYSSSCELRTATGSMQGHYVCVTEAGQTFDAPIGIFLLDTSPAIPHMPSFPAPTSRTLH